METATALADLRVVARTSACRFAGGLVALEDAGPADAPSGKRNRGPQSEPRLEGAGFCHLRMSDSNVPLR